MQNGGWGSPTASVGRRAGQENGGISEVYFDIRNIWPNFAAQKKQNYRITEFCNPHRRALIAGQDDWVKPPSYPVFCLSDFNY